MSLIEWISEYSAITTIISWALIFVCFNRLSGLFEKLDRVQIMIDDLQKKIEAAQRRLWP